MRIIKYCLLIITVTVISSCGESTGGLFYSLEQESEIINGGLSDDITIGAMARSNDYYFLSAGKFYYKKYDASIKDEWSSKNPTNSGNIEYQTYNMILVGNTIYAVFSDVNSAAHMLYSADTSTVTDGLSWTGPLDFTLEDATEKIIRLVRSENLVFIFTTGGLNNYNVYAANYSGFSESSTLTTIASDLTVGGELRVDYDGTDYWLVAGNQVLKTDGTETGTENLTSAVISASSSYLRGEGFGGIVCADTDTDSGVEVYVTAEEGVIMKYINSSWERIKSQYDEDDGLFEPLTDIVHIVISNTKEDDIDILLVGSENGYYEMEADSAVDSKSFVLPEKNETALTKSTQFASIDLNDQIIQSFYLDDTTDGDEKVFALGYNSGLWVNSLKSDDGYYRFWDAE